MPRFEILESELQKLVKVTLDGDGVRAEAGALHYYRGRIDMQAGAPKARGFLTSMATGEGMVRPVYTGKGEVFFGPPVFGEFVLLELRGETWILDQGAFVCSDLSIQVDVVRNKGSSALLGGEGMFQTSVSGTGTVVVFSPGRVQRVDLRDDRLAVDGSFAVARTGDVAFTVERAAKSLVGSMASGEGLLSIFEGTGTVLLAPVANLYQAISEVSIAVPETAINRKNVRSSVLRVVVVFVLLFGLLAFLFATYALPRLFM
ncbi:MAG: AIM24 family protein [Alphaproteobacteria bacterium]|nr:AIM24 family protein [Alphaproteobacteria bacterium]